MNEFALVLVEIGDNALDLKTPAKKFEFVIDARHVVHFADVVPDLYFDLVATTLHIKVLLE